MNSAPPLLLVIHKAAAKKMVIKLEDRALNIDRIIREEGEIVMCINPSGLI